VGAGYFAVLNEPLLAGHEFVEADQKIATDTTGVTAVAMPIVLNQKAAQGLFGNQQALGKRVRHERQSYEVVGVVNNLKSGTGIVQPLAYVPLTAHDFARPPAGGITILARSDNATDALTGVRRAVASIDPKLTLFNVQTLSEYLELSRTSMRTALRTFAGIGLFGLILSAIGLAGVTGYAVAQRRKEIGIRMALGAQRADVLKMVVGQGMAMAGLGIAIGLAGAYGLSRLLTNLLFGVKPNDPLTFAAVAVVLALISLVACWIPARRATRVDPLLALRYE
jgi:putative ABC transport system permease protein